MYEYIICRRSLCFQQQGSFSKNSHIDYFIGIQISIWYCQTFFNATLFMQNVRIDIRTTHTEGDSVPIKKSMSLHQHAG